MPDLSVEFCGVKAPNPFWLASAPPTNSEYQVRRAFDLGWGGAVWKTLAREPIVNVSSRYGAIDYDGAAAKVAIHFHDAGLNTLADELARQAPQERRA